ncbi:hypothetical protein [Catenulispora pinisilvae]|uniref:hypothetical protein n=1 Tax=Catenulispora pinisilvae TaxID=2705253 RepID=UPI0018922271|nr:hypothetical protein [Catenulispora pinisilvae]
MPIDVDAWAQLYGMNGDPTAPIQVGPLFDPDHAATADLRRPLILITLTRDDGDEFQLIADGCHRLYRGYTEGRDRLPAWILTAAETRCHHRHAPLPEGTPYTVMGTIAADDDPAASIATTRAAAKPDSPHPDGWLCRVDGVTGGTPKPSALAVAPS